MYSRATPLAEGALSPLLRIVDDSLWMQRGPHEMPLCYPQGGLPGVLIPKVECPAHLVRLVWVLAAVQHVLVEEHNVAGIHGDVDDTIPLGAAV